MRKFFRSGTALVMALLMMLASASTAFAAGPYNDARSYRNTIEYLRLEELCEELAPAYGLDKRVSYAEDYNTVSYQIKQSHKNYEAPIWDYLSRSTRREIEGMTAYQAAFKIRESAEYKDTGNSALRRQVDYVIAYLTNDLTEYLRVPLAAFYPSGTLKLMDIEQLIELGRQVVKEDAYRQLQNALYDCYNGYGNFNTSLQYRDPDTLNAYYADISEALLTYWLPGLSLS